MSHDHLESTSEHHEVPTPPVTATLVAENERSNFLPKLFPATSLSVEIITFASLDRLSIDYTGGYWEFYSLSNQGGYLAPSGDQFRIQSDNGFSDTVSGDAAGIIATLYGLSTLSMKIQDNLLSDRFIQLREYSEFHPESSSILAAID